MREIVEKLTAKKQVSSHGRISRNVTALTCEVRLDSGRLVSATHSAGDYYPPGRRVTVADGRIVASGGSVPENIKTYEV